MKNFFKIMMAIFIAVAGFGFASCSDDDESETLVTKYTYNLSRNENYYIVYEYHCVDNGDTTYNVKSGIQHYFNKTKYSAYSSNGGGLIYLVEGKAVTATTSKSYTQSKATTATAKNSAGEIVATFNIPAGMSYTVCYYE